MAGKTKVFSMKRVQGDIHAQEEPWCNRLKDHSRCKQKNSNGRCPGKNKVFGDPCRCVSVR